jgi:hypothetical protein
MFTLSHFDTLVGQVTPEGVTCLIALYIQDAQPYADLARLCRVKDERTFVKRIVPKLELHNYASTNGLVCFITSKARTIIREMLSALAHLVLLGTADPSSSGNATASHSLASGSATDESATDLQPVLPGLAPDTGSPLDMRAEEPPPYCAAQNARGNASANDLDQIRSIKSDQISLERSDQIVLQNAQSAPQNSAAEILPETSGTPTLEQMLTAWKVTEPARSEMLSSDWVTVERFQVALDLAEVNPKRTSASPIGLALYMLRNAKGRVAIDREIAATKPAPVAAQISEPIWDQVLTNLRQHYGDLFSTINPRLVETDDRPLRWTILVASERPELKDLIFSLARGFSRRQYQIRIVTAWRVTPQGTPTGTPIQGTSYARSTNAQSQGRHRPSPAYTAADHDLADAIRARSNGASQAGLRKV